MTNCKYCGQEVEDGFEFCHKCGKKLYDKSRWSRKRKIIVAVYIAFVLLTLVYGFIPTLVNPPQVLHMDTPPSRGVAYTMLKWYEVPVKDLCYSTFMRKWFTRVNTENVIMIVAVYCVLLAVPFVIAGFKKQKLKAASARQSENVEAEAEKKITRITAIVLPCIIVLGCAVGLLLLALPDRQSTGRRQAAQLEAAISSEGEIPSRDFFEPSDFSDMAEAGQAMPAPTQPASVQKAPGQSHQSTAGVADPKSAAKAIMDGCGFKVVVENCVYVPFVSPDIQVFLDESADIDAIGWQVKCSVNGQEAALIRQGNSSYEFTCESNFSIPLKQGHNLLNFVLSDSYGNTKSVTKEVIFEALPPETHLGVGWGVFEYKLDWLSYYDQISNFDFLVDSGTYKGNFDEMNNEEYYNEFRNLKITINGTSYTPTVIDAKRGIRQTGSDSIFTPIVYEANNKQSELIIPVDPSQTKTYKVTYTNKYGLSVSKTVTLS